MTHISGFERSQILLLPEAVDDYVGADNPVRFIDAFVDELDLSAAGFVRAGAKAPGRPGYAPADLLKLYIYGYLNRVRSSRRLEMESWLLRSLKPDCAITGRPSDAAQHIEAEAVKAQRIIEPRIKWLVFPHIAPEGLDV
jgi:transposase